MFIYLFVCLILLLKGLAYVSPFFVLRNKYYKRNIEFISLRIVVSLYLLYNN